MRTCVVDHEIDAAKMVLGRLKECSQITLLGDIAARRDGFSTGGLNLPHGLVGAHAVDIRNNDPAALTRQAFSDRTTAAAATGRRDDGNLVAKIHGGALLLLRSVPSQRAFPR